MPYGNGKVMLSREEYKNHPVAIQAQKIIDYIRRHKSPNPKQFRVTYFRIAVDGSWECHISPGLYCLNENRSHARNNTFIGSRDSRRVWYRCIDPKCRETIYFDEDFTAIVHPNRPSDEVLKRAAEYCFQ
jgi:hypothetical protein